MSGGDVEVSTVLSVGFSYHGKVDVDVFSKWLSGASVTDTALFIHSNEDLSTSELNWAICDVEDQFRMFSSMEKAFFLDPETFVGHPPQHFPHFLPRRVLNSLINGYYSFDEAVAKEFLGKNIYKIKKELEFISTKTGISLYSCKRQRANLKRVFKYMKHSHARRWADALVPSVAQSFMMSRELSVEYVRLAFLSLNRFEPPKKKSLSTISYAEWCVVAENMLSNWTSSVSSTSSPSSADLLDIDSILSDTLKDLKQLLTSDKERSGLFSALVRARLGRDAESSKSDRLSSVVKGLLSMSSDLSTKKERKSFFNTLIDRVIDPCIRMDMNEAAIISVLDAVDHAVGEMMKSTDPTTYESAWKRFTIVVKSSVKIMFDHLD